MRQAFLQSIAETPDDDAPRLIFADWLDDHGDHDRAEFIRLQCRLAGQVVPDADDRLRAEDLLDAHEHEWLEEFPPSGEVRSGAFERGFVARADVATLEDFRQHAAALRRTPARKVRVEQTRHGALPPDWPAWDESAGLTGLAFQFWPFDPDQTTLLAASPHLADLRSLAITYSSFDSGSMAILAGSPQFAGLTHLDLTNHLVDAAGIRALAASEPPTNLRTLDLNHDPLAAPEHNRFDEAAVVELSLAGNLSGLVALSLCPYTLTEAAAAALADSPVLARLRSLRLAAGEAFVPCLGPLVGSPLLEGLEHLDLGELHPTADDVAALAASPPPAGLRSLALGIARCGVAGVETLLGSPWAARLQTLRLVDTPGRDDAEPSPVPVLAGSPALAGLRELDLRQVSVGEAELKALARSPHLGRLASLKLGYRKAVVRVGLRALAETANLPALRRLSFRGACLGGLVTEVLADSPLAARLVALNLRGQCLGPDDVRPFLDRSRWPGLVRLELAENQLGRRAEKALRLCWGPAARLKNERRQYDWYD